MSDKQPTHQPTPTPQPIYGETDQPTRTKSWFSVRFNQARDLFPLNLAWFFLSLPVITLFPALGGLYHAVWAYQHDEPSDWRSVWEGFRKHWFFSLQWGLLILLGYLVSFGSIWFFREGTQDWHPYAVAAGVVFAIIWAAINQFSFPLLLLQKEKNVLIAIRNGYVVLVRRPLEALKVLLVTLVISAVSTAVPPLWILVGMALIVQIQTRSVLDSVEKIRAADRDRDTAQTHRHGREQDQESSDEGE